MVWINRCLMLARLDNSVSLPPPPDSISKCTFIFLLFIQFGFCDMKTVNLFINWLTERRLNKSNDLQKQK